MPVWLLRAYAEAIPRLQAGEALQAANVAMVAGASSKKGVKERNRILNRWRRTAHGGKAKSPGTEQAAAVLGIAFVREKKPDV